MFAQHGNQTDQQRKLGALRALSQIKMSKLIVQFDERIDRRGNYLLYELLNYSRKPATPERMSVLSDEIERREFPEAGQSEVKCGMNSSRNGLS